MTDAAPSIPFIDLQAQRARIAPRIDAAIARVLAHGAYVMGPEVAQLEAALAEFAGVRHAISCSNGTDALILCLRALGVGPGDAVFVPAFTFAATAEAVVLVGATPVFVDVAEDDFNLDCASLEAAIDDVRKAGELRPRAVIPVDLFGQPADYRAIEAIARRHDLAVIDDAAQSFGATYENRRVGTLAPMSATSFFPAKPLGCYGDGGAVFTDDDGLAELARSLRSHGAGADKYDNARVGTNARLDTLQAAILLEKLAIFPDEIVRRQQVADRYAAALGEVARVPALKPGRTSVWAQYTLVLERRDAVQARLKAAGVPSVVYYPRPLNAQTAYRGFPVAPGGAPASERLSASVLSLPMHPYLEPRTQDRIADLVLGALR
jgi:dTDP-4-amino-4,6-dideoxygalactose transaminase